MMFADQRTHRVLSYIASISRQGYVLTVGQVNAYASRADRTRRVPISAGFRAIADRAQYMQRESPLVWLYRVDWIELHGPSDTIEDDDTVEITALGRAALAALDDAAATARDAPSSTIILDRDDPIVLAKVIGKIAEMGPTALVDRYFREEVFLPVAQGTEVQRILMGPEPSARVAAIEQALADYKVDRAFEVRVDENDEYHDRYVIPIEGPILALGTSISGVGDRHSSLVEIKDEAVVRSLRQNFERVWNDARVLNPAPSREAPTETKKEPREPSGQGEADSGDEGEAIEIADGEADDPGGSV